MTALSPIVVVSAFYSRTGSTEKLATAAAVGAVQSRAGIRMRRVSDPDPAAAIRQHPDAREPLERMLKEYVPPREGDVLAADVLILGSPGGVTPSSPEWALFFALLERLRTDGKLTGKVAAAVGEDATAATFNAALHELGFAIPSDESAAGGSDVERAVDLGRRAVALAEKLRARLDPSIERSRMVPP